MAKIKFGMMMVDGSGKLGGQVFSKNRGGSYVRTKVTPLNPQTSAQSNIRGIFASISSAWSNLTDANRQTWNNLVADYGRTDVFGDIRNPSGKNLFQRLNQNLAISGQALIDNCTQPSPVPFADVAVAEIDTGTDTYIVTANGDLTGTKVVIWATAPLSQGTKFVKNKLRQLQVFDGGNSEDYDFTTAYQNKFGVAPAGANIYVGVRVINSNGQASPLEVVKAEVFA